MFGTVQYYINSFKATIMNNYSVEEVCSLKGKLSLIQGEIAELPVDRHMMDIYMANAEKAYSMVRQDVTG
ncbi:hypothetical protein [Cytobacillus purgationiresistens]|uniref:Uncharacterized protein n=1 Tax=Cytobacillus purgationiresistens TaxID=863449 RepID=A0ABU0APH7_9BACI|nr:hypothetical protein [Cytobacillus purgationiresistens]MDQ0273192.1 hypothetical protein [Cytobacillus purgationiresistens]